MTKKDFSKPDITQFLFREYELTHLGDPSESLDFTIEHILPREYTSISYWKMRFDQNSHRELLNVIGNLLPSTGNLNSRLSNKAFPDKKIIYSEDSSYKTMRKVGRDNSEWNPDTIKARTEEITNWILEKWKY